MGVSEGVRVKVGVNDDVTVGVSVGIVVFVAVGFASSVSNNTVCTALSDVPHPTNINAISTIKAYFFMVALPGNVVSLKCNIYRR